MMLFWNKNSAKQSTYWRDGRVKANNPIKTNRYAARWGQGAFTCTHTLNDARGAWWLASFYGNPLVTKIQILNRADCCGGRLNNAKVFVGKALCGVLRNPRQGSWVTVNCRARGTFVKIVAAPRQYLHFCGIRAWGYGGRRAPRPVPNTKPVAVGFNRKAARQSTYWRDGRVKAWNPFKTNRFNARWGQGAFTCTHTLNDARGAWWQVNLAGNP
jgi:hypothetical protein